MTNISSIKFNDVTFKNLSLYPGSLIFSADLTSMEFNNCSMRLYDDIDVKINSRQIVIKNSNFELDNSSKKITSLNEIDLDSPISLISLIQVIMFCSLVF